MPALVARLARTGLRRGLREGSKPWLAVGVAAGGIRLLSRMARSEPEVVCVETLKPGDTISISVKQPTKGKRAPK